MNKLKSRKLWITIGVGVLWGILKQLGISLPDELIRIIVVYLLGQSAVDIAQVIGKAKTKNE